MEYSATERIDLKTSTCLEKYKNTPLQSSHPTPQRKRDLEEEQFRGKAASAVLNSRVWAQPQITFLKVPHL